jgi:hypothetical protein
MTELTFEEFCELRFEYRMGITFDTGAQRMYRNDKHSIQVEVYTDRNKRTETWVGLAAEDRLTAKYMQDAPDGIEAVIDYIEAKLKELNT